MLHIACGLPYMNGLPPNNFERFSQIECEKDWGLIHIQYEILVLLRLINLMPRPQSLQASVEIHLYRDEKQTLTADKP
jgi:hypothetical protein